MITTVRPKEIFRSIGAAGTDIVFPMPQEYDAVTILETALLIAAGRSVNACRFFEFGTYLGRTTLHLAMNNPGSTIFTLDLRAPADQTAVPDAAVMEKHFSSPTMAFENTPFEQQIKRLYADSRVWEPDSSLTGSMDFAFIDGAHSVDAASADTRNARRMVRPGGVIIWHDYRCPIYPELTGFLESMDADLIHIGDTSLLLEFR